MRDRISIKVPLKIWSGITFFIDKVITMHVIDVPVVIVIFAIVRILTCIFPNVVLEIWVIGSTLAYRFDPLGALILAGLTPIIGLVFAIIPAAVGLIEGGYGAVFYLMGLSPAAGVSLQLIRRIRGLIWSVIGLGYLARYRSNPATRPL